MRAERPEVALDGRYNITDAARKLGVCAQTLRKYEREGRIKFFVRTATRSRVTTGREIIRIWNTIK